MNKKTLKIFLIIFELLNIAPIYIFIVRYVLFSIETVPMERWIVAIFMALFGMILVGVNSEE